MIQETIALERRQDELSGGGEEFPPDDRRAVCVQSGCVGPDAHGRKRDGGE